MISTGTSLTSKKILVVLSAITCLTKNRQTKQVGLLHPYEYLEHSVELNLLRRSDKPAVAHEASK